MPSATRFRKGFGLPDIGEKISGWVVESSEIEHIPIKRYRKYRYPIHYEFEGSGDISTLKSLFNQSSRIIYTRYGNPYRCSISLKDIRREDGKVVVEAEGYCERIFRNSPRAER